MPNAIITPKIVGALSLKLLQGSLVYKELMLNDYSAEFNQVGDTINVRKRNVLGTQLFDGEVEVQDLNEQAIPVVLDRHRDVTIRLTSKERNLDIKNFEEQVLAPAIIGLAEDIDADCAAAIASFASATIAKTEEPTDLKDLAKMGKVLDKNRAPKAERSLVLAIDHKYDYAITPNLSQVSYAGDNQTLREAQLGKIYGMNSFEDQNNVDTRGTQTGTATAYKVTGTKGQTHVALSTVAPSGGTVKIGEGFVVDGHIYRFTADATASSTDVSRINIEPKLHKNITTSDVVMLVNAPVSVAFQKNAVAFVTRQLEKPEGAAKAEVVSLPQVGLNARVVFDYDSTTKEDIISIDVLYGIAKLNDKLIVALK